MKILRFEDVDAWQAARKLANLTYNATKAPAFESDWELRRQMRKAATSAMANIAEGFGSGMDGEFRRFLRIAKRSTVELQSHLYVALDQAYLVKSAFGRLYVMATDVRGLIGGFIRYLEQSLPAKRS